MAPGPDALDIDRTPRFSSFLVAPNGFLRGEFYQVSTSKWQSPKKRYLQLNGATLSLYRMEEVARDQEHHSMIWSHDVRDIDFFLGAQSNSIVFNFLPRRNPLNYGRSIRPGQAELFAKSLSSLATWMDTLVRVASHSGISSFYRFALRIGHGRRGAISLGWSLSSSSSAKPITIKTIPANSVTSSALDSSLAAICNSNRNILSIHDVFRTNRYVHIVTEYARGGSLESVLRRGVCIDMEVVRTIFAEILQALQHLHDEGGRVHGTVTARNVLFLRARGETEDNYTFSAIRVGDGGSVVLKTFGLSQRISRFHEALIDSYHLAPEILCFDLFSGSSDIFSAGTLLYRMLGDGSTPFEVATTEADYLRAVARGPDFSGDSWQKVGRSAISLISSMLSHAPHDRPSAGAVLRSPWVRNVDAAVQRGPPSAASLAVRIGRGGSIGVEEARGWHMEGELQPENSKSS